MKEHIPANLKEDLLSLLDLIPDNLTYQDTELKILWANRGAAINLGKEIDEIIGKYCYTLWHGRKEACKICPVQRALQSGSMETEEVHTPDGRIWELRAVPVYDDKGHLKGCLEVGRDITEKVRAFEEIQKRYQDIKIINNIIRDITSSINLDQVLQTTAQHAAELLEGDASTIALYDEDFKMVRYPYHYNMPESLKDIQADMGSGLASYIIQHKTSMLLDDYPSNPRAKLEFVRAGVKTMAAVPIIFKDKVLGALGVFGFSSERVFTDHHLELLEAVGKEVGIAIENARIYEKMKFLTENLEQEVKRRTDQLQRLVNAMAGREVRMAELKRIIRVLTEQLKTAGLTPLAEDPLSTDEAPEGGN